MDLATTSLARPTPSSTLVLVALLPAAALVVEAALGRRLGARARRALAVSGPLGALAASAYHAWVLLRASGGEAPMLLQHVASLLHVGELDVSLALTLDAASALACLAVAAAALVARAGGAGTRASAAAVLAMLVAMAGDLVTLLVAWEAVALAASAARGRGRLERVGEQARHRAAAALFLLGVAVLYWGLAAPEAPRFVATTAGASGIAGAATLTLTHDPGATVYLDDARTPLVDASGDPLRAPFVRAVVPGGFRSARVHAPVGGFDHVVAGVDTRGEDVSLDVMGPTVELRAIREQLAVREPFGDRVRLAELLARRAFGAPLLALACTLFGLAILARAAQLPFPVAPVAGAANPREAALAAGALAGTSAIVVLRLAFLFENAPGVSVWVATAAALTAVVLASAAPRRARAAARACALAASGSLAIAAAFAAYGGAAERAIAVTSLVVVAAAGLARRARRSPFRALARAAAGISAVHAAVVARPALRLAVLVAELDAMVIGSALSAAFAAARGAAWACAAIDRAVLRD